MRNLRRITVIMVMVCLMIGQSGCAGIFDSTKSEVRIAKKVLKEKYNEDFEIISLGGRGKNCSFPANNDINLLSFDNYLC